MTPIISPWWFYFADVCNNVNICLRAAFAVLVIVLMIFLLACAADDFRFNVNEKNVIRKLIISIFIVSIPFCLIPSQNTIYKMMVANIVTENNIQAAQNNTIEFIEKVVEAMEKAKEK